jgi:hypothetical protein
MTTLNLNRNLILYPSCVLAMLLPAFCATAFAGQFKAEQQADRLVITHDGKPVAHFVFHDTNTFRPYFAHVHTPDGVQVTRNHPPIAGKDPVDHPTMHPGIWMAFGNISGQDFWRNRAVMRHDRFVGRISSRKKDTLAFVTESTLISTNKEVLGKLKSSFALNARKDGYLISWNAAFTPAIDSFVFGDQEEMGFGVRVATPLSERNGGVVKNSAGLVGAKNTWGQTAEWCDYSGVLSNKLMGITVMTDPKNFRPSWMHSRDYGLVVANPFGQKAFTKGEASAVPVKKGKSFNVQFAAFIHSTPTNQAPDIAGAYQAFIKSK